MPRRQRTSTAGLIFHVVNRAAKRAQLFGSDDDYEGFVRVLRSAVARSDVALYAYCLMPNHWHLLLSPTADGELSRFMHWLTTTHARRWQTSHGLDGQGAVYQGRFKAIPVNCDQHFLRVCRYVERNPLRAFLVGRAEEWRWSSLSHPAETTDDKRLLTPWPITRPVDWIAFVNSAQTEAELDAVRRAIQQSEPFGDEAWREAIKRQLGILAARRRGRPRGSSPTISVMEK